MSNPHARPGTDDDIFSYEFSSVSIAPLSVPPATVRPSPGSPYDSPPHIHSPPSGPGLSSPSVISPGSQPRVGTYYSMHAPPDYVPPRISPPVRITRPPASSVANNQKGAQPVTGAKLGQVDSPSKASGQLLSKALPIVRPSETKGLEGEGQGEGVGKKKTAWDEAIMLLDEVATEYDQLKTAYSELSSERTSLNAQVSIMQNQLDNVEQIRNAYEDRLNKAQRTIDSVTEDKASIIAQAQDKLAQQRAAMEAREGQLLQHITNYEQAHSQAARDMYALDDEKRIVQLELDSSQQQVDALQQRVQHLQTQLKLQAQHQSGIRASGAGAGQHQQWDDLAVQENNDLRHKIALIVQENTQLVAERRSLLEHSEKEMIEREEQNAVEAREMLSLADADALKEEIDALRADKCRLEEDYAELETQSQAAIDAKREVERTLQHIQLENAKLRAHAMSPRVGSAAGRLDTPPHSPENLRRFTPFPADDSFAGDLGALGSGQSTRSGAGSHLSSIGRNSADSGGLRSGKLITELAKARSADRNTSETSILEVLPVRPSSTERILSATDTPVGMARALSGPTFGVGIRRAPQGPPTPGATSFQGTRTPPAFIPGITRERPQPIGTTNASNTASSVWYSTPKRDSTAAGASGISGTSWETMRKSMGVGEGAGASGGTGAGGDRVAGTVLASGRLSGSALDWQWRRPEGKEGGNAERDERGV